MPLVIDVRIFPLVPVPSIEEHHGASGRLRSHRRAFPLGLVHCPRASGVAVDGYLARDEFSAVIVRAGENDFAAIALAVDLLFEFLVPTITRQPAAISHHAKLVVAQRDDLRATPIVFVFALVEIILTGFRGIGEGFGFGFFRGSGLRLFISSENSKGQGEWEPGEPFHKCGCSTHMRAENSGANPPRSLLPAFAPGFQLFCFSACQLFLLACGHEDTRLSRFC